MLYACSIAQNLDLGAPPAYACSIGQNLDLGAPPAYAARRVIRGILFKIQREYKGKRRKSGARCAPGNFKDIGFKYKGNAKGIRREAKQDLSGGLGKA